MLYKLTSVALLFFVNANYISANGDKHTDIIVSNDIKGDALAPRVLLGLDDNDEGTEDVDSLLDDLNADDTGDDTGDDNNDTDTNNDDTNDNTDDNNDDNDDTDNDGTDDNDDTDDTDDNDDTDGNDDITDSTDIEVTSVSADNTESGESADNTSSGDDDNDDDSTSNTQSGESDDNSSDNTSSGSNDDESGDNDSSNASGDESNDANSSDDDDCVGLSQSACSEIASADGDQECGFNAQTDECYTIERRAGTHGSGNFDDGYNAAQEAAAQESGELYTIVGVLGGVIAALSLIIAGAGYYMFNKNKTYGAELTRSGQTLSINNEEELIEIRTTDDALPMITK